MKSKNTSSKILKTVIQNANNHLESIDKTLIENNRRIDEIMSVEKLSPSIMNLLFEIKRKNNSIMLYNKVFKNVEVIINNEDDCN